MRYPYDPYEHTRNQQALVFVGLTDGPINETDIRRGASSAEISSELVELRGIFNQAGSVYTGIGPTPESVAGEDRDKRFIALSDSEVYFVFYEDCGTFDPPINYDWGFPIGDDWNALWNWREDQAHKDIWNRLKVSFVEAVQRIAQMQPLPLKPRYPYTMEPDCKNAIDALLPNLVPIPDQDTAPYKLVCDQLQILNELEQRFAELAAEKLMLAMSQRSNAGEHLYDPPHVHGHEDQLSFRQCQYDNWQGWHDWLQTFCHVGNCPGHYDDFPTAVWDLSQDPDFAQSEYKFFKIRIEYDDAHAAGW